MYREYFNFYFTFPHYVTPNKLLKSVSLYNDA
jgi:hypothetical protein